MKKSIIVSLIFVMALVSAYFLGIESTKESKYTLTGTYALNFQTLSIQMKDGESAEGQLEEKHYFYSPDGVKKSYGGLKVINNNTVELQDGELNGYYVSLDGKESVNVRRPGKEQSQEQFSRVDDIPTYME